MVYTIITLIKNEFNWDAYYVVKTLSNYVFRQSFDRPNPW